jgi:5S rRNA maturation endonuclease (ribonuclease M5)
LYCWEQVRRYREVILVEGLFDYAVVWQAGFYNVTCSMGNHLNGRQCRQLCDRPRTVYLAFDADTNGSGQQASQSLACRLKEQGMNIRRVSLPDGHDPNRNAACGSRLGGKRRQLEPDPQEQAVLSTNRGLRARRCTLRSIAAALNQGLAYTGGSSTWRGSWRGARLGA